jgi:hypothetical protein
MLRVNRPENDPVNKQSDHPEATTYLLLSPDGLKNIGRKIFIIHIFKLKQKLASK